jgi:hypothetical protein
MEKTLFDQDNSEPKPKKFNQTRDRKGKFANKYVSRAELAEKKAVMFENQCLYYRSLLNGTSQKIRQQDERIAELEKKLLQKNNK